MPNTKKNNVYFPQYFMFINYDMETSEYKSFTFPSTTEAKVRKIERYPLRFIKT